MAIFTESIFYMLNPVTQNNYKLNFDEGAGELTADFNVGSYTVTTILTEIERAMNAAGTQDYTAFIDRDTRKVTISAASNFDLLISSGSNVGLSVFSLIGFTGVDLTGSNSYEGDAIGFTFAPPYLLQSYKDFANNKVGISPSVNESASGEVEIITFGSNRFMEMNIKFVSSTKSIGSRKVNPNGLPEAYDFLDFCIEKFKLEFIKDKTDTSTFDTVLLESTRKDKNGVGYELKEDKDFLDVFETGVLKFRKI